ncbi:hypothetical protein [Paenibacillus dendritiformis]|uniref:hypothetical protein n=1 Tax=Paenibacillus dendritiformis TaxID=130049 RepID=UPI0002E27903|nr:hypothetical protein [Paenibacillus dendritiformis]CAH8771215.1 hypothetical protein H7S4_003950 [Paenibacillus dendritiformis]
MVIVAYLVYSFLNVDSGLVNRLLKTWFHADPVAWYSNPDYTGVKSGSTGEKELCWHCAGGASFLLQIKHMWQKPRDYSEAFFLTGIHGVEHGSTGAPQK